MCVFCKKEKKVFGDSTAGTEHIFWHVTNWFLAAGNWETQYMLSYEQNALIHTYILHKSTQSYF